MEPSQVRAFAPGRANLIGEHTDYNAGLCLPFALEQGVTVVATSLPGTEVDVRALDLGETDRFPVAAPEPVSGWRAFARGAIAELGAGACRLEISGDVRRGAGLASSAALSVALCLALGADLPPLELARLCARIESDWVGQRTGLLDQLASLHGRPGHALRIDLRGSPVVEPVPLDLAGHRLVTLSSGSQRDLAASGYNERRAECERAAGLLGLASLRDATPAEAERLPDPLAARVRHVLSENARVEAMVVALRDGDLPGAGALLDASHASLRDDYVCSTDAVERTVAAAREAGAIGARMVGGGFGGSVLALFPPGSKPPAGALELRSGGGAGVV